MKSLPKKRFSCLRVCPLAFLSLTFACTSASTGDRPDLRTADDDRIPVTIEAEQGPLVFMAELADSPEERARGLMYRESLGSKDAMLFVFPTSGQRSFWMRNTLIPLDMLFIRDDRTILGIVENATPKTDRSRGVPGASQFVLEINGGTSSELGIRSGQKVSFYSPIPQQ